MKLGIRILILLCASAALTLAFANTGHAAEATRPNVIFILTDDQGWGDARFAGHPYVKTPNLDRLASQGTWFKQFYVAATVCSPSRCAFMTSHYPARHLIHGHFADHSLNESRAMPDWLDPKAITITKLLRDAGYATAHFGKWHLGNGSGAPPPDAYGIEISRTVNGSPDAPALGDDGSTPPDGKRRTPEQTDPYFRAKSSAMIVDETIKFIKANRERPFYVNVWTLLPHAPLKPTPEQLKVYESLAPRADDPAFGEWMQKYLGAAKDLKSQMQVFCASLTDLDAQIGRLMQALDDLKLGDNTIVFFSSDNGAEDYHIGNASNAGVGNTGPLRARKRSMYEGGIRTFGVLRWPGKVAAGRVDETSVIAGVDWLPTICKLAGVAVPESVQPDGEDVSDIWLGQLRPRRKPLYWEWLFRVWGEEYQPPMLAIRDDAWKLFVNHDGSRAELYDIPKDFSEKRNVALEHPDMVKELTAKALAWQKTLPPSKARETAAARGEPVDKPRQAAKAKTDAPAKPALDRAAIFKNKDTNHDGKMTLEEYLNKFPDEAEGRRRFPTFDTNKDGVLSEEEFVTMGKPQLNAK
ncbi:MAG: sulfatase-like hydrolase/transferase [Candidatus Sumerlaeota bacterium]|nr:sulfatase-like hydrolase/transferase [Candidatus Sumerlaeota bacterium]